MKKDMTTKAQADVEYTEETGTGVKYSNVYRKWVVYINYTLVDMQADYHAAVSALETSLFYLTDTEETYKCANVDCVARIDSKGEYCCYICQYFGGGDGDTICDCE